MLRILIKNVATTNIFGEEEYHYLDIPYDNCSIYTINSKSSDGELQYHTYIHHNSNEYMIGTYSQLEYVEQEMHRLMNIYTEGSKDIVSPGPFYFSFRSEEDIKAGRYIN